MKKRNNPFKMIPLLITAFIFCTAPTLVKAQANYKLTTGPDVSIKVLGSSNIHDWTMVSTAMESQGEFKFDAENLTALRNFNFQLAFKSLKSEHESMDDRTYKAVNESKFPTITYKLTSATISTVQKGKFLIATKGELTIAGVSQAISMEVTAVVNANKTITCSGSKKIQLTEYGIKPPTYMLGTMKVYNDLTIQFNLLYKN